MYVSFESLPKESRVWIYQSDRRLTIEEVEYISAKAISFIESWTRHGSDLKGSFTIKYNQFLVLSVDESYTNVSGCSIDASVRFIKELEDHLNIDLTDKLNITYKEENLIVVTKLADFQEEIKQGNITGKTIVFNNLIQTKHDLENNWETKAEDSWHNRFLV